MKKISIIALFIGHITLFGITPFDHIITFFVRQYPKPIKVDQQKMRKTLNEGKLPYKILKSMCPPSQQGIVATYAGYVATSNHLGQITLPRLTQKPSFLFIVTPEIKPIFMLGNTVHHWELMANQPAAFYKIERLQDPETKLYYWSAETATRPKNNIVPLNSITIFAKPKNIYIPEGITLTDRSVQLVLPTIYAKSSIKTTSNALYYLSLKQFFTPINFTTKKGSSTYYSTHIKP